MRIFACPMDSFCNRPGTFCFGSISLTANQKNQNPLPCKTSNRQGDGHNMANRRTITEDIGDQERQKRKARGNTKMRYAPFFQQSRNDNPKGAAKEREINQVKTVETGNAFGRINPRKRGRAKGAVPFRKGYSRKRVVKKQDREGHQRGDGDRLRRPRGSYFFPNHGSIPFTNFLTCSITDNLFSIYPPLPPKRSACTVL